MPRGMFKSRTFRRIAKTTPGGENKIVYTRRQPSIAHCGRCGAQLHGIPRGTPRQIAKLSKTQKRPERPFGGVLCSSCLKDLVKFETRETDKE